MLKKRLSFIFQRLFTYGFMCHSLKRRKYKIQGTVKKEQKKLLTLIGYFAKCQDTV